MDCNQVANQVVVMDSATSSIRCDTLSKAMFADECSCYLADMKMSACAKQCFPHFS